MAALRPTRLRSRVALAAGAVAVLGAAGGLTACGVLKSTTAQISEAQMASEVEHSAGFTRIMVTAHYVLVVNVLPAEPMFDEAEHMAHHRLEGELVLDGVAQPMGLAMRHVEVHVYDRRTGAVVTGRTPEITVINHTTGERTEVPSTLMQDINIGEIDQHFGNNIKIPGDSDLTVSVVVNGEEASVDGHLD